LLAGAWTRAGLRGRAAEALGDAPPWLGGLVNRVRRRYPTPPIDGHEELAAFIAADRRFQTETTRRAWDVQRWFVPEARMVPVSGPPADFSVFPLESPGDLARNLGLTATELDWFADLRGMNARTTLDPLLHYHARWVAKASGGYRLLEAPKARLKRIQRFILRHVLAGIPPAPAAHGFVVGRNVRSFVLPHAGRHVLLRLDLEDFFTSVARARVAALFRRVGYPGAVARALAGLCTAITPLHVLAAHPRVGTELAMRARTNQRLRTPHLPQGSPTSPALSNLAAFRLDRRLAALASAHGATLTRYADDLAFSGDRLFARSLPVFLPQVGAIALEEGFAINHRKTRVMRRGRRQQLCGLVINDRPNLPREEVDNLRALLFNAGRFGPDSQNRQQHPAFRSHLEGRIAWVASIDPARARRLQVLFEKIPWPGEAA
jgi:RNA-directed DNA polymerase